LQGDAGVTRLSLVGDWGTGTDEASEVADRVNSFKPHYTIHLGDVYYVGDEKEIRENCLNEKLTQYDPCLWPHGSRGSFGMNGNHEMYARGKAYFDVFLPTLGLTGGPAQQASFFCLENDFWRFVALDTGYNSVKIPFLERIPVWPFHADCALPDELIAWLRKGVLPAKKGQAIVLLSHHQYYSSFEGGYTKPAKQLKEFLDRPVIWIWGHEHRLAIYDKHEEIAGVCAYGRCLGHGGMPVEFQTPKAGLPLLFVDDRQYPNDENLTIGFNGHANVTLQGADMVIDYVDLHGTLVFSEQWISEDGTPRLVRANAAV
jgi:predicted phosphodiesterase